MAICTCSVISPPVTCNSYCIQAPNMLVSNSVTACDSTGEIDISPVIAKCGTDTVHYTILSYKNVASPTITSSQITFTPVNNNYEIGEITYKVSCGILSDVGKITIVYKDNCVNALCGDYQTCDKCTGDCNDDEFDYSTQFPESVPPSEDSGLLI